MSNELGLKEADEVLSPEMPEFEMSDRDMEEIENSLKRRVVDRYSDFEDKEVLNGYQSFGIILGSQALNFSIPDPYNPIKWVSIASSAVSGLVLGWHIASDDFGEGLFKAGDILPDLEKHLDLEELERDYQVVDHSLSGLIADSEKVEVDDQIYDSKEVADWYEDLLQDYDDNELGENNNLQLLAFTDNEGLWEYRLELKSSGESVESIRGLSEQHPEFYIDRDGTAEVDYEEVEKILA